MVVNKREALYLNYFKRLAYFFAYIPPLSISLHSFQQSLHQQIGVDLAARKHTKAALTRGNARASLLLHPAAEQTDKATGERS